MTRWIDAGAEGALEPEDVARVDHAKRIYALYRDEDGAYFASDAKCTHERALLTKGFVVGHYIECPLHQGRFDVRTGKAMGAPVCVDLATYPVRLENGRVMIGLPDEDAA
jgi:3-phenylpropionate/trans-cinnamate dioxygenase ferredoxin subunit